MTNTNEEWTISFVGCGFLGVYSLGVYGCLLERTYELTRRMTKICGASSGALIGAMIVFTCLNDKSKCCKHLTELATEARKGMLGSMHPSFNLLKLTRDLMDRELPDNTHLLASGRLCVSLTRISDGENVLVSDFASKNDLIQVNTLLSEVFDRCGSFPDKSLVFLDKTHTDLISLTLKIKANCRMPNTITVSPFSGGSDICPYDTPFYFHEVMAEMYQNGYKDALNFLKENGGHLFT
uniref:PNPLA domain-containing protein n=1 Tax=Electrophorus electricus TaxID=8005 RepID=A0A4W4H1H5_ELEEL